MARTEVRPFRINVLEEELVEAQHWVKHTLHEALGLCLAVLSALRH
jgi:L-asparaginase II